MPSEVLDEARQLHASGDYAGALERYRWLVEKTVAIDASFEAVRDTYVAEELSQLAQDFSLAKNYIADLIIELETELEGGAYFRFDLWLNLRRAEGSFSEIVVFVERLSRDEDLSPTFRERVTLRSGPVLLQEGRYDLFLTDVTARKRVIRADLLGIRGAERYAIEKMLEIATAQIATGENSSAVETISEAYCFALGGLNTDLVEKFAVKNELRSPKDETDCQSRLATPKTGSARGDSAKDKATGEGFSDEEDE